MLNSINIFFIIFIFIIVLCFFIPVLSFFLSEKNPDKEKLSVYECGFSPIYQPGKPFSIKFFIVAILFIIFDLEIILLIPWVLFLNFLKIKGNLMAIFFFFIIILGLYYEWLIGALEWD